MTINSTKYFVFALSIVIGMFIGCQNNRVNPEFRVVTGTVSLNDSPVEGARVTFFPLDTSGLSASGVTDASGKYSLTADGSLVRGTGTNPGEYQVTIKKMEIPVSKDREDLDAGKITKEEYTKRLYSRPAVSEKPKNLLPEKFADPSKTPLKVVVEDKKENVIDFRLN
jgi:hypothetical protein